jgi:hypothetical protein
MGSLSAWLDDLGRGRYARVLAESASISTRFRCSRPPTSRSSAWGDVLAAMGDPIGEAIVIAQR